MVLGCFGASRAQTPTPSPAPPSSDIFLVEVINQHGQIKLGQPMKISQWPGYNNQPSFFPDGGSVLYTSIRDKQADIYRYEIRGGGTTQITVTPESEYSPTVMPDTRFISVVRVEADGTQRLWRFPLAGGKPSLILEKIKPVGYHLWLNDHTLALFVLGKPNTLQIVDVSTEKAETVADNPGRVLRRIPHQDKFSFVHKISDQEWIVESFDLKTRSSTPLVKTMPGVEDYAWMPSGQMLMAKDAKLFIWNPSIDKDWREIADLSAAGLMGITRIAVSPKGNRLAIVARRND